MPGYDIEKIDKHADVWGNLQAYASRGPGGFGDINYGDCQYYSRNPGEQTVSYDNQAYPKDMIAALGSADPDYPGSCGRCYEVK